MHGDSRRKQLYNLLETSKSPISGDKLASLLGVSRQVIVQDIALLRAMDKMILSTNRGYLTYPTETQTFSRIYLVSHTTEEIKDELYTIVDLGGFVKNVMVNHDVYGIIQGELSIASRRDVDCFVKRVKESDAVPLKTLGWDLHSHTVEADNEEILDEIQEALEKKGYLRELTDDL